MPEENKSIRVEVKFFSGMEDGLNLKDRQTTVELQAPFSTFHLLDTLIGRYPILEARLRVKDELAPDIMVVINNEVTRDDLKLQQGDVVFLMYVGVGG